MGATVSAYVVLTFVLYFWGSAFAQPFCGNSPTPPSVFLVFRFPGAIVGVLDWAQTKLAQTRTGKSSWSAGCTLDESIWHFGYSCRGRWQLRPG